MKRPSAVTLVAVLIIIFAAISLIGGIYFISSPAIKTILQQKYHLSDAILFYSLVTSILLPTINIISAIAMLKGANWGRWVYLIINVCFVIVSTIIIRSIPISILINIIVFIMFLIFLFSKPATDYFHQKKTTMND